MRIPLFNPLMISNPTLPKMYWEVKSQEQLVANLYCIMDALKDTLNEDIGQTNANTDAISTIQQVIDSIESGNYTDKYIDGLAKWIDENLAAIVCRWAYFAFPGFEQFEDGTWHFTMTVPRNWAFLKFQFPFVTDDGNNGTYHIMLTY